MKTGSLFSGYRGLDAAVEEHFGATPAWSCDNDPDASRLLAHHWPTVPNLGDITAVDWSTVEPVEILTGGWPCQPWSVAGKRKGKADARALWPEVERAVRALRPRLVVLENVPNIVPLGELARAVGDLAALGYVGSWLRVGAHEVGAPHRRQRIFIVASDTDRDPVAVHSGYWRTSTDAGGPRRWGQGRAGTALRAEGQGAAVGRDGDAAPDAASDGRNEGRTEPARELRRPDAAISRRSSPRNAEGGGVPNQPLGGIGLGQQLVAVDRAEHRDRAGDPAEGVHLLGGTPPVLAWGAYEPAIRRWERIIGRLAPAPTVDGPRGGRRLNPELPEWMMGLPLGHITAVPGLTRNAMLRLAGNGVVPQQALLALSLLAPVEVAA